MYLNRRAETVSFPALLGKVAEGRMRCGSRDRSTASVLTVVRQVRPRGSRPHPSPPSGHLPQWARAGEARPCDARAPVDLSFRLN